MTQHFLLSAKARPLSLCRNFALSDDEALEMFKQSRWGHHPAICPDCGSVASITSSGPAASGAAKTATTPSRLLLARCSPFLYLEPDACFNNEFCMLYPL